MDEIRRLQEAFRQAQAVSSSNRLSERNCVEIVNKIKQLGLLVLLNSLDGKEYITPARLEREVLDELYIHKGRISVSELQIALSVNSVHIESAISKAIAGRADEIHYVHGELITRCALRLPRHCRHRVVGVE